MFPHKLVPFRYDPYAKLGVNEEAVFLMDG